MAIFFPKPKMALGRISIYLSVPGYTKICDGDPETETLNTSDMGQET